MDTEWPSFLEPPPSPPPRPLGTRIGIGIAASMGVWFVVDQLTAFVNGYVVAIVMLVIAAVVLFKTKSNQRSQQFWVIAILGACAAGWVLLVFLFSFFNIWLFLALTAMLAIVVFFKDQQQRRRQHWLDTGCCGRCGYDLRATPERCPECGRESSLDEPTWRKLRREWGNIKPVDEMEPSMVESAPEPVPVPKVPTILRTPDFHEGPIPLEGNSNDEIRMTNQ